MRNIQPDMQRRRIAILGSTGSIGQQTLDVVRSFPQCFEIVALVARSNIHLLAEQAREFQPLFVGCTAEDLNIQQKVRELIPEVVCGADALLAAATHPDADVLVTAMSGLMGLQPTLAAICAGKTIALANKETLVMAGHLVMEAARHHQVQILPVDSEHSAIWQCLRGEKREEIRRLILTASGGSLRNLSKEEMRVVSLQQVLAHPTWNMGSKISIDSATLMNKGLEVIEAHWLFNIPYEQIEVIIHPQSIIHSMVEFVDNSMKLQASLPSMHLPIQDALSYPYRFNRQGTALERELNWSQVAQLDFAAVDLERFPCLRLAIEAGKRGGTAPAALTGADEQAVSLYLQGKIHLTEIAPVLEQVLANHRVIEQPDLPTTLQTAAWAQCEVQRLVKVTNRKIVA